MDTQTNTLPTEAWFGRRPPAGTNVIAAWGARAIIQGRGRNTQIDVLHDRKQSWSRDHGICKSDAELPPTFTAFIRGRVFPWLRQNCGEPYLNTGSRDVFSIISDNGLMVCQASPQGSYGYLYIGAWMLARPETGD